MRSELVYRASGKVPNRFRLCRLTASSARSMTRSSVGMHITINQALEAISGHAAPIVAQPPHVEEDRISGEINSPVPGLEPAI